MFPLQLLFRTSRSSILTRPTCGVQARIFPTALWISSFPVSLTQSQNQSTMASNQVLNAHISPIEQDDFDEWERLFRAYIDFYKSSLPDTQYRKTFDRILDTQKDLHGLVLRDSNDSKKLYGLAHYFPMQTPWAEEQLMHFNGKDARLHSSIFIENGSIRY